MYAGCMNEDQETIAILEILENLYELYARYPDDEFITSRIGMISTTLCWDLDEPVFFDLAEGYADKPMSNHYRMGIERELERLNELRRIRDEEAARMSAEHAARMKEFSEEGYKIDAYYQQVNDGKIIAGSNVVIFRDKDSGELIIHTGPKEFQAALYETLREFHAQAEPTQQNMELVASHMPDRIGQFIVRSKRVIDSADWLNEKSNRQNNIQ